MTMKGSSCSSSLNMVPIQVEDCSQAALQAFTTHMASILGVEPTDLSIDCNFAGSVDNLARRSLLFERALQQVQHLAEQCS